MADLHRLVRLWLLACLALVSFSTHADFPANNGRAWAYPGSGFIFQTADAACRALIAHRQSQLPTWTLVFDKVVEHEDGGACWWKQGNKAFPNDAPTPVVGALDVSNGMTCPVNATLNGQRCSCDTGFKEHSVGGKIMCVKPDDRTPEQLCEDAAVEFNSTLNGDRSMRVRGPLAAYADGAATCAEVNGLPEGQGCKHWFTGDLGFKDEQGGSWTNGFSIALNKGDQRANGSLACSLTEGSDPPKEDPPPDDCRQGYKTTVMGVELCIEAWTGETEGNDRDQTTDGEGNKSNNKTNIKCVGDQCTITETTTTTKPDGSSTTHTTTTENVNRQSYCARNPESAICRRQDDKDGGDKGPATRPPGGGGSGDGDGEGDGFCKENPDSPICKKSTWGGSCVSSFQCDGDAIQCAIAKEQHIRACKLFDDASPESALYESNKNKEGAQTKDLPGSREESMANRISTADAFGGGGQCIQDLNIAVMGQAVSLPMSKVCPILGVIGNIMIGVALLLAVRIVGRG